MGNASTIKRLEPQIREEIGRLRSQGRTIDEILGKLRELQVDVSRSALGRHVKQFDEIAAKLQQSRVVAEAIAAKLGDTNDNKVSRVNTELMHSLIMKMLVSEEGAEIVLDPEQAFFMSSALQKLAAASKTDADRELKIRKEITDKAIKAVEKESRKSGLSQETIDAVKKNIFGAM